MNTNTTTGREDFAQAVSEMRVLDAALARQLHELAHVTDARFAVYASVLQRSARIAANCGSAVAAVRWNLAGALAAKSVIAAGKAISARKHNQKLDKLLDDKRKIASGRLDTLRELRPRIARNADTFGRLMQSYASRPIDPANVPALTAPVWQALECRRSALHMQALAGFLESEYTAWLGGEHSGNLAYPVPADANRLIYKELYGDKPPRQLFEQTAAEGIRTGRDLMLLADPALALMAVHGGADDGAVLCIDTEQCSPEVAAAIKANPGLSSYAELVADYSAAAGRNPVPLWNVLCACIAAATAANFWLAGDFSVWTRALGSVVYLLFAARVWQRTRRSIISAHVATVRALAAKVADYVRNISGDFAVPEADLSRRDPTSEALKSFIE